MSRVIASLVLMATFINFTLHGSISPQSRNSNAQTTGACSQLRAQLQHLSNAEAASELYKKAFTLSFDRKWKDAETASVCAALLYGNDAHWPIDAESFFRSHD